MKYGNIALLADLLTLSRGIGVPIVFGLLVLERVSSLSWLGVLLTYGFYSDIFDGILARRQRGTMGKREIYADVSFLVSSLAYTTIAFSFPIIYKTLTITATLVLVILTLWVGHKGYVSREAVSKTNAIQWFQALESGIMGTYICSILGWMAKDSIQANWPNLWQVPEAWCILLTVALVLLSAKSSGIKAIKRIQSNIK